MSHFLKQSFMKNLLYLFITMTLLTSCKTTPPPTPPEIIGTWKIEKVTKVTFPNNREDIPASGENEYLEITADNKFTKFTLTEDNTTTNSTTGEYVRYQFSLDFKKSVLVNFAEFEFLKGSLQPQKEPNLITIEFGQEAAPPNVLTLRKVNVKYSDYEAVD